MPFCNDRKLALVLIPGNASRSLAQTVGLDISRSDLHLRASELRKQDSVSWKAFRKVVVLRPTILRYQAAVQWCAENDCGNPQLSALAKNHDADPDSFLEYMATLTLEELPLRLRPQTWWMDSAFDDFVSLDKLAGWCNENRLPGLRFTGGSRHSATVTLPTRLKAFLASAYHQDEAIFARLRTWHPNKKLYDTLYGVCKSCTAALRLRD